MHHCISHGEKDTQKTKIGSYRNIFRQEKLFYLFSCLPQKNPQYCWQGVNINTALCCKLSLGVLNIQVNSSWHSSLVPKEITLAEVLLKKPQYLSGLNSVATLTYNLVSHSEVARVPQRE